MTGFDPTLSRLVITEEDWAHIVPSLQHLLTDSGAKYGVVIDHSGQMLAWESDRERPEMPYLGAPIAATYASTQESPASSRRQASRRRSRSVGSWS